MALLFADGFDWATTGAHFLYKWRSASNPSATTTGRFGTGLCVRVNNSAMTTTTSQFQSGATFICGFALFPSTTGVTTILQFIDAGSVQLSIGTTASNEVIVRNSGGGALLTTTDVLSTNVWYYIEVKAFLNGSTGTLEIRVDGESWGTASGLDTLNTANAYINQLTIVDTANWLIDDLYLADTTGSTNNDFLGDVRIETIIPSGAGTTTQWTPSAGSNFQCVDDGSNADDDTTYVSTATVGNKDTYATGNLATTVGTIKAVIPNMIARKDDAGSRSIQPVVRHSGADYDGTGQALRLTYQNLYQIYETNPGTSAAWAIGDVNGAEFGVKVSA